FCDACDENASRSAASHECGDGGALGNHRLRSSRRFRSCAAGVIFRRMRIVAQYLLFAAIATTGCGQQTPTAADFAALRQRMVEPLAKTAEATLQRLDYKNVHIKVGDGYKGWPEEAPFDAVIVTCAPEKVPQPLVDQLKDGGCMVIPVGERFAQQLYLLEKKN